MVDQSSPIFSFSEKIGMILGKGVRYLIFGSLIAFICGKLTSSKLSQPIPTSPSQHPPTTLP